MEVARAEDQRHDEEEADPGVEGPSNDPPHHGLAECTDKCQDIAQEIELGSFGRPRQEPPDIGWNGV